MRKFKTVQSDKFIHFLPLVFLAGLAAFLAGLAAFLATFLTGLAAFLAGLAAFFAGALLAAGLAAALAIISKNKVNIVFLQPEIK